MVFKGKQPLAAAADTPTKEEEDPSKAISAPADPDVNGKAGHTGLQQQKQREELHRSSHSQREAAGAGWRSEVQEIPKQKSFLWVYQQIANTVQSLMHSCSVPCTWLCVSASSSEYVLLLLVAVDASQHEEVSDTSPEVCIDTCLD